MAGKWVPRSQYLMTLPKATSYAIVYFTDEAGRPLQLRSRYATEMWQHAGGNQDPGESPLQTALRECREETGIVITKRLPLLLTHFMLPREDWPYNHIGFAFDGGTLTNEQIEGIVLDPSEHTEWSFRELDEWEKKMGPGAFARLKTMDAARRSGVAGYLESIS